MKIITLISMIISAALLLVALGIIAAAITAPRANALPVRIKNATERKLEKQERREILKGVRRSRVAGIRLSRPRYKRVVDPSPIDSKFPNRWLSFSIFKRHGIVTIVLVNSRQPFMWGLAPVCLPNWPVAIGLYAPHNWAIWRIVVHEILHQHGATHGCGIMHPRVADEPRVCRETKKQIRSCMQTWPVWRK